jgi:hypothetical protein
MVEEIKSLGRRRYVGDKVSKLVHDRWHPDCQGCGLRDILWRGDAVGFEPDTLDGALWEGYEYCEGCHDRTDPDPPEWADSDTEEGDPSEHGDPPSVPLRLVREASSPEVRAPQQLSKVSG